MEAKVYSNSTNLLIILQKPLCIYLNLNSCGSARVVVDICVYRGLSMGMHGGANRLWWPFSMNVQDHRSIFEHLSI